MTNWVVGTLTAPFTGVNMVNGLFEAVYRNPRESITDVFHFSSPLLLPKRTRIEIG